jgi:hypothetical protein
LQIKPTGLKLYEAQALRKVLSSFASLSDFVARPYGRSASRNKEEIGKPISYFMAFGL